MSLRASIHHQVTCWTKTGDKDPEGNRFLFGDESGGVQGRTSCRSKQA